MEESDQAKRQYGAITFEPAPPEKASEYAVLVSHRSASGESTFVEVARVPVDQLEKFLVHLGVDGRLRRVGAGAEPIPDRKPHEAIAFALDCLLRPASAAGLPPENPVLLVLDASLSSMRERVRDWRG